MPTSLIRFEVRLPVDSGNSTSSDKAVESFLSNLSALIPYTQQDVYQTDGGGNVTPYTLVFGLLTSAQASTGLSLLNTLNSALGSNVLCFTWNVSSQP